MWYLTLWRASAVWVVVNYGSLVTAAGIAMLLSWQVLRSFRALTAALWLLVCTGTVVLNAWHDRYEREWREGSIAYRDTHGRWNPRWSS